ncbi:MAG: bifunctional riboflavin kinase/FAD synthetase [Acidobacteria bacterium]|nr:bifunctional riboflavin kinase/FAD synthetase [Acidobacteriota bacterium]
MRIIREIHQMTGAFRRPVVTIGNFDGVHAGHLNLLRLMRQEADRRKVEAVLVTFHPHPLAVLAPDRCPALIQTLEQKLEVFATACLDGVVVYPFNRELSGLSAEEFVRDILVRQLSMSAVVIGAQFSFGRDRRGNTKLLRKMGADFGFDVIPAVETEVAGEVVSSTRIRNLLMAGELETANQLLGRPYAVDGQVVCGLQIGKKIGFPTANVESLINLLLPSGVFATTLLTGGKKWEGAANLGIRPTIQTGAPLSCRKRVLEIHLFDYTDNLYGCAVRVNFHRMIRFESSFPTLTELITQIRCDVDACRSYFRQQSNNG